MEAQRLEELPAMWKVQQMADYFEVHRITAHRWTKNPNIIRPREIVRIGRSIRIRRSAIVRLIKERQEELGHPTLRQTLGN